MEYIPCKTIVTKNKNTSWFGTDYNMNIYRGCSHGCIYCDSRSDCYRVVDFDRVRAKEDALRVIRDDLLRKVRKGVVGTGSMSDPYNPFEKDLKLTRNALELLNAFSFGSSIATKSPLVTRDVDILKDISSHSPVIVKITITTADDTLCQKIEPNVAPTSQRFAAIETLSNQGLYCGVLLMPILPYINDTVENVVALVRLAKERGAHFVYPAMGVTLRSNQRDYFFEKLNETFPPGLVDKYKKTFGERYSCGSPKSKALFEAFVNECEKLSMVYQMKNIVGRYKSGYENSQLSFFE